MRSETALPSRLRVGATLMILGAIVLVLPGNGLRLDPRFLLLGVANAAVAVGVLINPAGWRRTATLLLSLQLAATLIFCVTLFSGGAPLIIEKFGFAVLLERGLRVPPLAVLVALEIVALWTLRGFGESVPVSAHA